MFNYDLPYVRKSVLGIRTCTIYIPYIDLSFLSLFSSLLSHFISFLISFSFPLSLPLAFFHYFVLPCFLSSVISPPSALTRRHCDVSGTSSNYTRSKQWRSLARQMFCALNDSLACHELASFSSDS